MHPYFVVFEPRMVMSCFVTSCICFSNHMLLFVLLPYSTTCYLRGPRKNYLTSFNTYLPSWCIFNAKMSDLPMCMLLSYREMLLCSYIDYHPSIKVPVPCATTAKPFLLEQNDLLLARSHMAALDIVSYNAIVSYPRERPVTSAALHVMRKHKVYFALV